jgi:hypothetical protein
MSQPTQKQQNDALSDVIDTATESREISAENLFEAIGEDGGIGRTIDRTFRFINIAERVIDGYQKMHEDKADEVDGAFKFLKPSKPLMRVPEKVFRQHCRQLLDRVVAVGMEDAQMHEPTDAEALAILMDGLDKGPLTTQGRHALVKLGKDILSREQRKDLAPYEAKHYEDDKAAMDLIERIKDALRESIAPRTEA